MILPDAFLDTNILLRHFLQDYPDQSPRCSSLVNDIAKGDRSVLLSETVIFEVVYVLEKQYRIPRRDISRELLEFVDFPAVNMSGKRLLHDAFELYVTERGLSFADCYHAVFALKNGVPRILTFDRRMGSIPGIERIEP